MSVKIRNMKKKMSLKFSGELTIYSAQEHHSAILEKYSADKNIDVDLSGVEEVDTSGLQLLVAMSKELRSNGAEIQIVSANDLVNEAIETSQFMHDLNCNEKESG